MASELPMEGRCGRKLAKRPGYCTRYPTHGLDYCATHGASTKRSKALAVRNMAEADAMAEIAEHHRKLGQPVPAGNHHDVLIGCVDAAFGDVLFYREQVAGLEDITGEDRGPAGAHYETVRVVVKLYHEAVQWLAKVTKMALDAGVDERKIRVTESMGAQIVTVMQGIAAELGYGDDPRFGEVAARHLRAVGE